MRALLLAVALAAALGSSTAALTGAAAKDGSVPLACKMLDKALKGTVINHHTTLFLKALPRDCEEADREPVFKQWNAELSFGSGTTVFGGPSGYVKKLRCEPIVKQSGHEQTPGEPFTSGWLTRAETGADVACWFVWKHPSGTPPFTNTHAYWAKGRWNGDLDIDTPPSGGGRHYIAYLLTQVTAQLPR